MGQGMGDWTEPHSGRLLAQGCLGHGGDFNRAGITELRIMPVTTRKDVRVDELTMKWAHTAGSWPGGRMATRCRDVCSVGTSLCLSL